jgi:hypothetical protein
MILDKVAPYLIEFSLEEASWIKQENGDMVQAYFSKMHRLKSINLRRATFDLSRLADLPESLELVYDHSFKNQMCCSVCLIKVDSISANPKNDHNYNDWPFVELSTSVAFAVYHSTLCITFYSRTIVSAIYMSVHCHAVMTQLRN